MIPNLVNFFTRYLGDLVFVGANDEHEARLIVRERLNKETQLVLALECLGRADNELQDLDSLFAENAVAAGKKVVAVYGNRPVFLATLAFKVYYQFHRDTHSHNRLIKPIMHYILMPGIGDTLVLGLNMRLQGLSFRFKSELNCNEEEYWGSNDPDIWADFS